MERNRIGMLRKEQGLNQRELGMKLGVGQTTVSAWETGKNEPDMNALRAMSQLFDVSVEYLSGFEVERWPGGYRNPEYQARIQQRVAEQKFQEEFMDEDELIEKELEELEALALMEEWEKGDKSQFVEVLKIAKMCEFMTEEARKRMVTIVQLAFPKAARGEHES